MPLGRDWSLDTRKHGGAVAPQQSRSRLVPSSPCPAGFRLEKKEVHSRVFRAGVCSALAVMPPPLLAGSPVLDTEEGVHGTGQVLVFSFLCKRLSTSLLFLICVYREEYISRSQHPTAGHCYR